MGKMVVREGGEEKEREGERRERGGREEKEEERRGKRGYHLTLY